MRHASRLVGIGILLAALVGGCGGGGDDGDDNGNGNGGTPAPTLPQVVHFGLGQASNQTLTAVINAGKGPIPLVTRGLNMGGTYNTLNRSRVMDAGFSFQMDTGALYGDLSMNGISAWSWSGPNQATAGAMQIHQGLATITVTVKSDGSGVLVQKTVSGAITDSQEVSWADFEEMALDTSIAQYLQIGALGYSSLRFLADRVQDMVRHVKVIAGREKDLQKAGSGNGIQEQGDLYPPLGSKGSEVIVWQDNASPFQQVGPADYFNFTFSNLWLNDFATNIDTLFQSGTLRLENYMENASPLFLGFERAVYDNVVMLETEEDPPGSGTFSNNIQTTLNGNFVFNFTPP